MSRTFAHQLRVRWGECDPQGIVFNATYLAYFDDALTALWREAFGSYQSMLDRGLDMVVAEVNVKYLGSARPEDLIRVEARVVRLGTTSISMRLDVWRDEELLVEGLIHHVFLDASSWEKSQIPAWLREGLEPYLTSDPEVSGPGA